MAHIDETLELYGIPPHSDRLRIRQIEAERQATPSVNNHTVQLTACVDCGTVILAARNRRRCSECRQAWRENLWRERYRRDKERILAAARGRKQAQRQRDQELFERARARVKAAMADSGA